MRLKGILLVAFMAFYATANAQFNWPEDPSQRKEAETLWTLFDDVYKQGDYEAAKPYLDQIVEKFPALSTATYINGRKIWREEWSVENKKKNKEAAYAAAQKVMDFYKIRYENFPEDKKESIDRYAIDAFFFYYQDRSKEKTQLILDIIDEAYQVKGNESNFSLGRYYMQMAAFAVPRKLGKSNEDLLEIYEKSTKHIDYQIEKAKTAGKDLKRYVDIKAFIDEKLADLKLVDCDFVVEKLVPQFEADPTNFEIANKIFIFAFDGGCTDAEWFTKASEVVFASSPNYGVGYMLGVKFGADKEFDKSKEYFVKAAELTDDNTQKGKAFKQIASTERINGNKAAAREYAIKAAEVDPALVEDMYVMIGDMIMGSSECDKQVSQVDDRARFIVAYDYYAMSGNRAKMASAQAQFPTATDIFTVNKEVGQSVSVGCWMKTTVKLQKRPN